MRLLEWLVTLPAERVPSTKDGLANELGVSPRTLRDWQAQESFRKAWDKAAWDISGGPEKTQTILDALHEYATDREAKDRVSAATTWLKATGAIQPTGRKPEQPAAGGGGSGERELTDADLEAFLMGRLGSGS